MSDCIFCKIAAGEIPSQKLFEDEQCLVFKDIEPAAPVHLLVIPKEHIQSQAHAMEEHEALLGHMVRIGAQVASEQALTNGFRMVVNTGKEGGQTVGHLHLHMLGGRQMHWPPG